MQKSLLRTSVACAAFLLLLVLQVQPASAQVEVGPQDLTAAVGDTVSIEIEAGDLGASDVASYQFTATYDSSVVEVIGAERENTLSSEGDFQINTGESGQARVAFASGDVLGGPGTLLRLRAVLKTAGTTTVSLEEARFFDQDGQEVVDGVDVTDGVVESSVAVTFSDTIVPRTTDSLSIPVQVGELTGADATSYQFTLTYDPDVINVTDAITEGTLSEGEQLEFNKTAPGEVKVAFASSGDPLEGPGTLLRFQALTEGVGTSPLRTGDSFLIGGSDVPAMVTEGSVSVTEIARAQFIHNAADPAAEVVDVFIGEERVLDDFEFRSATPYVEVPAGVEVEVGVAPGNSEGVADTLASFPVTFTPDQSHTVVANGVLNPAGFASNPDGEDIGFRFFVDDGAREEASSSGSVDLRAVHGATDAPTVDIEANGTTLFDSVVYGDISGYVSSDPQSLRLVVRQSASGDVVTAFQADLSGLEGESATVLASGFLDPAANQDGPGFALVAARSNGDVVVLDEFERSPITVDIDQSFGDATDQNNYRLVALPGQVNLGIETTLTGEPGESNDWRAFWDDGSSTTQEGLVEFEDGSSTFNFQAGRGFWVLSKNNWAVSQEFQPVALGDGARASIPLHDGWNIISNPLGKDLSWASVQSVNDVSEPLWSFSGSFSQASTFPSAQSGEAFYFFNAQGLDELQIPFFPSPSSSAASKRESAETIRIDALVDGEKASSVWVGTHPDAEKGKDRFDNFSPPGYFTDATLAVANGEIESKYSLASDLRPTGTEGHAYDLTLQKKTSETLTLRARGLSELGGEKEVRLYNNRNGRTFDLRSNPNARVEVPSETAEFTLLVGTSSYVEQETSEIVPDKLDLRQYPNPIRAQDQATIEYSLPEQAKVSVKVYDILGRRVRTLVSGEQQRAGVHTLRWDARGTQGQALASGVYFARLSAGDRMRTIKMVVVE